MILPWLSDENLFTILYFIAILALFGWLFNRNRGKILVRIKTPIAQEDYAWVKPSGHGKRLCIRKPKRGKDVGWEATIISNSIMTHKAYFGLKTIRTVDIMPESKSTISYEFNPPNVSQPILSADEAAQINATDGFRRRYGDKPQGQAANWMIWGIFLLGIINVVLMLRSQGIVRF